MSWAQIKYAVNSLIGTNKFKPLNEIIEERTEYIIEPSNDIFIPFLGSDYVYLTTEKVSKSFLIGVDGEVCVKYVLHSTTGSSITLYPIVSLYINDKLVHKTDYSAGKIIHSSGETITIENIEIKKGDVIKLEYSKVKGDPTLIRDAYIYGTPRLKRLFQEVI